MTGDVLVRVVIPGVVIFCMTVVGLDLTLEDFRRVTRHPRLVGAGVLGPVVVLPVLAMALGHVLALPPAVAEGMLLVAACPTAILSNLYTVLRAWHRGALGHGHGRLERRERRDAPVPSV